jgi:hypothetical protein
MSTSTTETPPDTEAQPSGETPTGGTTASPSGQGGWSRAAAGLGTALPSLGQVDKRRLLWVGGLVAAGALGVLEWPVAAAVGIGSYVAEAFAKSGTPAGTPTTSATSGTPAGAPATGATSGTPAGTPASG